MRQTGVPLFERTPIFIICRDRFTPLISLIEWLEWAGHERIYLVDNDSAWPPLLEYYDQTPHTVIRLGVNGGHLAPWQSGVIDRYARGDRYVVTDPDVVPDESCPRDAVSVLDHAISKYPDTVKAGLGVRTDDLPSHYPHRDQVLIWEEPFTYRRLSRLYYRSSIDTTFALYRENLNFARWPAIRTGQPYLTRHMTWYQNPSSETDEERFYATRASSSATWTISPPHRDSEPHISISDKLRWYAYAARLNLSGYLRQLGVHAKHISGGTSMPLEDRDVGDGEKRDSSPRPDPRDRGS